MRKHRREHPNPALDLPIEAKLKVIAVEFSGNLSKIAAVGRDKMSKGHKAAAAATKEAPKMPKKHVIAAAFAMCELELSRLLGPLWWRCSMSESKAKPGKEAKTLVKDILAAIEPNPQESYDKWPAIEEFMHDFSASSHSIPQVTGKERIEPWKKGDIFEYRFVAESEMAKGSVEARSNAITRDLLKLCLVECPVKAVVYRGYDEDDYPKEHAKIVDDIVETTKRTPSPGANNHGWLLIGLVDSWPSKTRLYFHTLKVGDEKAKPLKLDDAV